jgi:hypothetical protein
MLRIPETGRATVHRQTDRHTHTHTHTATEKGTQGTPTAHSETELLS